MCIIKISFIRSDKEVNASFGLIGRCTGRLTACFYEIYWLLTTFKYSERKSAGRAYVNAQHCLKRPYSRQYRCTIGPKKLSKVNIFRPLSYVFIKTLLLGLMKEIQSTFKRKN